MSMRLLPKEPIMLRDTSAQDRVIEPKNPFKRHRKLIVGRRDRRRPAHCLDRGLDALFRRRGFR